MSHFQYYKSMFDHWIQEYDLFLFDFDGTLVDTEPLHYQANLLSILHFQHMSNISDKFNYSIYEKYAHSIDLKELKHFIKYVFHIDDYEAFYQKKQEIYKSLLHQQLSSHSLFIQDRLHFLEKIIHHNKSFVIVTNTSRTCIQIFKDRYPILHQALKIYTKEDFHHKKPHPECYLRVDQDFPHLRKIGFEDSLRGFHSLHQVTSITPVFLPTQDYFWTPYIRNQYSHFWILLYQNKEESFEWIDKNEIHSPVIENMIDHYQLQIQKNKKKMTRAISQISLFIQNLPLNGTVYLTGMGKSGYVCKKSASTWQSLSLPCIYLDLPNLPHGDFGILKHNDIILFISNSGNTDEIVYILKYLKNSFHKKVFTICIVANENSQMQENADFCYVLDPIQESDEIGMTPSVSSALFMMVLDMIAIYVRKDITKNEFQMNHPSGSLGKK